MSIPNEFPNTLFILYSSTLKLEGFDLQNVPTSTGRADVIIRAMKSVCFSPSGYNQDMGLLLFPNPMFLKEVANHHNLPKWDSKGFLVSSKSNLFQDLSFLQASEHMLLKEFYRSWFELDAGLSNSIFHYQFSENLYETVEMLVNFGYSTYLLHEDGKIIKQFDNSRRTCFILGDQLGYTHIDSSRFPDSVEPISIGKNSYLSSTTVSLIKWMNWENQQNNT